MHDRSGLVHSASISHIVQESLDKYMASTNRERRWRVGVLEPSRCWKTPFGSNWMLSNRCLLDRCAMHYQNITE
jgi:hypothetical protein